MFIQKFVQKHFYSIALIVEQLRHPSKPKCINFLRQGNNSTNNNNSYSLRKTTVLVQISNFLCLSKCYIVRKKKTLN